MAEVAVVARRVDVGVNDLIFRARRYSLFEGARLREATMERHEGLPEYTGTVVAMKETGEVASRLARQVESFVEGPTLNFPKVANLHRTFNPYLLVPFGTQGTYYPNGTFSADWGKLQVESVGAILSSDNRLVRVVAPADARALKGPGWTLELEPGWAVRPMAGRNGSFEVVNAGSGARQ